MSPIFPGPRKFAIQNEVFKVGDVVQAKVLTVDQENEKFTLGIKQLNDDPGLVCAHNLSRWLQCQGQDHQHNGFRPLCGSRGKALKALSTFPELAGKRQAHCRKTSRKARKSWPRLSTSAATSAALAFNQGHPRRGKPQAQGIPCRPAGKQARALATC